MPYSWATGRSPLRGMDIRLWGFGLVCCGEGDGDGRRPVDDALVIRHRASPPPLLRSSGDSGVPGRGDATGPLPLCARRTTDWSGPDVRDGSYGVGCTVLQRRTFRALKASRAPGPAVGPYRRNMSNVASATRSRAHRRLRVWSGGAPRTSRLGPAPPRGSLMSALPASLGGVGSF